MSIPDPAIKALWVALCIMLGLLVGVAAGLLAWLGGQHPPAAILIGGGAFGGTVTVALTIMNAKCRALWVALCIMLGLLVGVAAGLLAWLGGQHPPAAILIGGGAFGGTVTVALMIMNALS